MGENIPFQRRKLKNKHRFFFGERLGPTRDSGAAHRRFSDHLPLSQALPWPWCHLLLPITHGTQLSSIIASRPRLHFFVSLPVLKIQRGRRTRIALPPSLVGLPAPSSLAPPLLPRGPGVLGAGASGAAAAADAAGGGPVGGGSQWGGAAAPAPSLAQPCSCCCSRSAPPPRRRAPPGRPWVVGSIRCASLPFLQGSAAWAYVICRSGPICCYPSLKDQFFLGNCNLYCCLSWIFRTRTSWMRIFLFLLSKLKHSAGSLRHWVRPIEAQASIFFSSKIVLLVISALWELVDFWLVA